MANPYAAGFRDGSRARSWGIVTSVHAGIRGPGQASRTALVRSRYYQYGTSSRDRRPARTPGVSGGGLLNLDGEMIGLTTTRPPWPAAKPAGGYAIPARRQLPADRRGAPPRRGGRVRVPRASVRPAATAARRRRRSIAASRRRGPACQAGSAARRHASRTINGTPIRDDRRPAPPRRLGAGRARRVELTVRRTGSRRDVEVTLGEVHAHASRSSRRCGPSRVFGLRVDYTSVLRRRSDQPAAVRRLRPGVCVREVDRRSSRPRRSSRRSATAPTAGSSPT